MQPPGEQTQQPDPRAQPPRKAIPPSRDRLQSRLLVWIVGSALAWLLYEIVLHAKAVPASRNAYLPETVFISITFALVAWRLRAATAAGAAWGGLICFLIICFTTAPYNVSPFHSGIAPLVLLFALTHEATQLGRERKAALGIAERRSGRNAAQVIANLGIAAIVGYPLVPYYLGTAIDGQFASPLHLVRIFAAPVLAALAEATADTVSSEVGKAFGGSPVLITSLHRVRAGTDGAISLIGTTAGIAAAAIVALVGIPAIGMLPLQCAVVLCAAIAGLFFDSLLGATLERRGWIGNDLVNFLSTGFAALVTLPLIRWIAQPGS